MKKISILLSVFCFLTLSSTLFAQSLPHNLSTKLHQMLKSPKNEVAGREFAIVYGGDDVKKPYINSEHLFV